MLRDTGSARGATEILFDVMQRCDKRAIEILHLLVAAVRAVSVVVVLMTVAAERACDEATAQSRYRSISVCGL
jgi:hypothetical protein